MSQRINITLPEETIHLIDRVTQKGNRSHFIDEAVRHYIAKMGRETLRKRLKEGALRRARRDLQLAEEWLALDEEAWPSSKV